MNRVRIQLPKNQLFSTQLSIRVSDINYGGHLSNDAVLSLIHEARFRMFNSWGYKSDLEVEGVGTIQLDTAIEYKGEGFHGDVLTVNVYAGEVGSRTFELYYEVKTNEKLVALGKTGLGIFDYEAKKMISIPEPFANKLKG